MKLNKVVITDNIINVIFLFAFYILNVTNSDSMIKDNFYIVGIFLSILLFIGTLLNFIVLLKFNNQNISFFGPLLGIVGNVLVFINLDIVDLLAILVLLVASFLLKNK